MVSKDLDLSAFLNVLFHYRRPRNDGKLPARAEFVEDIIGALIPNDAIEKGEINGNPLNEYSDRQLQYIFSVNDDKHLSADKAAQICRVMDPPAFETYFSHLSYDRLVGLSDDINAYGFDTTPDDVVRACSNIMTQLMEHIAAGKPEAVTQIDANARDNGKRSLKDILPSTISFRDGRFDINGEILTVDMDRFPDTDAKESAMRYVEALYEAYASALGKDRIGAEDIAGLPLRFQRNYQLQNRAFFYADSVQHAVRDIFDHGEEEFSKLKEDELIFIDNTYWKKYDNGFERLVAVLDRAVESDLSSSVLANIRNLINNLAKMGICQILVNEGEIKSWVIEDE